MPKMVTKRATPKERRRRTFGFGGRFRDAEFTMWHSAFPDKLLCWDVGARV